MAETWEDDHLASLKRTLANVNARIEELTGSLAPDYSLDGQSESLASYLATLRKQQTDLRAEIIAAEGPVEVHVIGTT